MTDTAFNPCITMPAQARSRATMERILDAAARMIEAVGYDALSMAELARTAEVGLGSLYARFPSKERLLMYLAETRIIQPQHGDGKVTVAPQDISAPSLEDFLIRYCHAVANTFTEHRAILRPLALLARASSDNELTAYLNDTNGAIHTRLEDAISGHAARSGVVDTATPERIGLAVIWIGASLREHYLFASPPAGDTTPATQIARAMTLFIQTQPKAAKKA